MHLILGTQRATGVVRDALVANCPLRIALRVAERAESRGIVGCDDAAELPGGAEARGLALLRRAADTAPRLTRIALTPPEEIAALAASDGAPRPAGPWLPPLPAMLRLDELLTREPLADDGPAGGELAERGGGSRAVVLGLADDPDRQRQPLVTLRPGHDRGLLVVGAAGSGKSTVARLAAAQCPSAIVVPREAEAAWDAVARVEHETPRLFVVDDLDALLARFPHDYAQLLAERLETIVREAGERGMTVLLTAARVTGATARIADLLPRRAVLALATRADHAAAGGDGASFDPSRPPGRALLDGREVQFATPKGAAAESPSPLGLDASPVLWRPTAPVTALVVRSPHRRGLSLSAGWGEGVRVVLLDELEAGARLERVAASRGDRIVVAGDGESWQRQWMLLQDARSRVPMVVGAECAAELRALTGERELPPFARTRAGRAWLVADGHPPRRIVLPG
jgi:S-DNA-T family DNA segregation ATPase FtsK/SpoIIIE